MHVQHTIALVALALLSACAVTAASSTENDERGAAGERSGDTRYEETAATADGLGEFGPGSIGGSDFGHLDLGGRLNPVGPTTGGPLNPTGRCEEACYAALELDFAQCRKLPAHQRQACWARAMESCALCIRDCRRKRGD